MKNLKKKIKDIEVDDCFVFEKTPKNLNIVLKVSWEINELIFYNISFQEIEKYRLKAAIDHWHLIFFDI